MQDDDRPPLWIEVPQRVVEELAVGDGRGDVTDGGTIDRRQLDLDRASSPTTRDVDTCVDDQLTQPGVELVGIAERRQVPPGPDETVLDCVTGELGIPKDQPGGRVQPCERRAGERGEGVMIALPC